MTAFNSMEGNRESAIMLTCPNCEFENPTTNRFCQQCGTLLETWRAAIVETTPQLLAKEPTPLSPPSLATENAIAPQSGVETGEIAPPPTPLAPAEEATLTEISPATEEAAVGESGEAKTSLDALDDEQRYRVCASDRETWMDWQQEPLGWVSVGAWDTRPSQPTFLEARLEQSLPEEEDSSDDASSLWEQLDIPAIARPYLLLQDSHAPAIPPLRDTWQYGSRSVVLIEDRAQWELLIERWGDEDNSLPQLLHWLDETVKLWRVLESVGCCQSLLEETNLRLDEDQTLCFQHLYPDSGDRQPTLQDLGKMWQKLFGKSGRTLYDPLPQFLEKVRQGQLTNIEEIRANLQAIAGGQPENPVEEVEEVEEETIEPAVEFDFDNAPTTPRNGDKSARGSLDDIPTVVLPMQLLGIAEVGCTDIGRQRDHNEDCFGISTLIHREENAFGRQIHVRGLYIVCDGMGGHAAGEVASALAVETLQQYFKTCWPEGDDLPDEETILQGIVAANQKIYEENQKNERSGSGRMGTTLVLALVRDTKIAIAHVGDSRIYRITRKHGIEQLTKDHEVGQREIQRGVDPSIAYARADAYQLTQALGPRSENFIKPDVNFFEINEDTLLLLCSDGLSDNDLLETQFQSYLTPLISSRANLEQGLQELIDFANHYNGHDNITGLVVRLKVRPNTEYQRL
ncbi:MAG: serine/threonine phosphatase [Cyanobacteriota bacterium]|nr:serine/threonine phosphatase [Cyanobacteriota bacterium]